MCFFKGIQHSAPHSTQASMVYTSLGIQSQVLVPKSCLLLLFGLTASPFRIVNLFIWKRLTICVEKVRGDGNWEFGAKIVSSRRWSSFIVMLGYVSDV